MKIITILLILLWLVPACDDSHSDIPQTMTYEEELKYAERFEKDWEARVKSYLQSITSSPIVQAGEECGVWCHIQIWDYLDSAWIVCECPIETVYVEKEKGCGEWRDVKPSWMDRSDELDSLRPDGSVRHCTYYKFLWPDDLVPPGSVWVPKPCPKAKEKTDKEVKND